MRTCSETELGRWGRPAAVLMVLVMVLSIGGCERSTAPDASSAEDDIAALVAEVGPDWEVVEDYLEREREWMARILVAGEASEDDSSPSVGEAASAKPRIFVLRASGDGAPPRAEVEQRLDPRRGDEQRSARGSRLRRTCGRLASE